MNTNMNGWKTEVCGYEGNVYTREVGPNDTTVYMDWVYGSIPWVGGKPDQEKVDAELLIAEHLEERCWAEHLDGEYHD